MDDTAVAIFLYGVLRIPKKRKTSKHWVHPINSSNVLQGAFYMLCSQLRTDETKFLNYFRMSRLSFDELLDKIYRKLIRMDRNMIYAVPVTLKTEPYIRHLVSAE